MLKIVIDVRRARDFGIGTYIRNLVQALGALDKVNRYELVAFAGDKRLLAGLPPNFEIIHYNRSDTDVWGNVAFPLFLRGFVPDLVHIPLNRVPLLMPKPYVVTIHDMASLLFEEASGVRMKMRRYRFRRGLERADRVIAVSEATSRDVQNVLGIPGDRVRVVYNAPDPEFFAQHPVADARLA